MGLLGGVLFFLGAFAACLVAATTFAPSGIDLDVSGISFTGDKLSYVRSVLGFVST
jgi:hypothetical protein